MRLECAAALTDWLELRADAETVRMNHCARVYDSVRPGGGRDLFAFAFLRGRRIVQPVCARRDARRRPTHGAGTARGARPAPRRAPRPQRCRVSGGRRPRRVSVCRPSRRDRLPGARPPRELYSGSRQSKLILSCHGEPLLQRVESIGIPISLFIDDYRVNLRAVLHARVRPRDRACGRALAPLRRLLRLPRLASSAFSAPQLTAAASPCSPALTPPPAPPPPVHPPRLCHHPHAPRAAARPGRGHSPHAPLTLPSRAAHERLRLPEQLLSRSRSLRSRSFRSCRFLRRRRSSSGSSLSLE